MHTPENKIDYIKIATEIAEWIERNFGYFVNKNSDKIKVIQDFAEQLERLPVESMSYIQQAKNNFIDKGDARPPMPLVFIQELKIILNKRKENDGTLKVISSDCFGKKYVNKFSNNGKFISRTSL